MEINKPTTKARYMAVVFTLGGRMFVAGGKGSSEDSLSLKLFDSVMNSWSWVALMLTPRCNFYWLYCGRTAVCTGTGRKRENYYY